jgi:hypothetical protein
VSVVPREKSKVLPWLKFFGAIAQSKAETRRIQRRIDQEFSQVDPLE